MEIAYTGDHGWIVVEMSGELSETGVAFWRKYRKRFDWTHGTKVVVDVTEMSGASDALVEALMGITADAYHRGGRMILVGQSDALRALISVMGMEGYISTAMSVVQARTSLGMSA